MNLSKNVKVTRLMNAQAAGLTSVNGTVLDMSGYDGVVFVAMFGTLSVGAVTALKAQQGKLSDGSDMADLAGTSVPIADTGSNKGVILDIYRPLERYIRPIVTRGTANAVIDSVIAIQYNGRTRPSIQDVSIAATEFYASPAEGNAQP